jgi:23S rRNA (uracil1939-C5)-methyltransferase
VPEPGGAPELRYVGPWPDHADPISQMRLWWIAYGAETCSVTVAIDGGIPVVRDGQPGAGQLAIDELATDIDGAALCAQELVEQANELEVEPYDELGEIGDLRYVWFKTDGRGQVLLTLITSEPRSPCIAPLSERLKVPAGIAWGVNSTRGNDLRGTSLRPVKGRQSLTFDIAGVAFHCGPLGFLQPNPTAIALAYHDLVHVPAGGAPHGKVALDLYAGAGVTTSLLRERFTQVLPCESYPESARQLGVEPELVEEFLAKILSQPKSSPVRHPDLVVANPPRGGLGPTVCGQLNQLHASRLHLMSCNPRSLKEDLAKLTGAEGSYRLIGARAFDTLPQTAHIELVAWLVGK